MESTNVVRDYKRLCRMKKTTEVVIDGTSISIAKKKALFEMASKMIRDGASNKDLCQACHAEFGFTPHKETIARWRKEVEQIDWMKKIGEEPTRESLTVDLSETRSIVMMKMFDALTRNKSSQR